MSRTKERGQAGDTGVGPEMVLSPVGEGTLPLGEWAGRGVARPPVYCIWPANGLAWPTNAFKILELVANI